MTRIFLSLHARLHTDAKHVERCHANEGLGLSPVRRVAAHRVLKAVQHCVRRSTVEDERIATERVRSMGTQY